MAPPKNQRSRQPRTFRHKIYVEKSFKGDFPECYWNYPSDFNETPDKYLVHVLNFNDYFDRSVSQEVPLYLLINDDGDSPTVQSVHQDMPDVLGDNRILHMTINSTVSNNTKNSLQIKYARRYPDLSAATVERVATLENQLTRHTAEVKRLTARLNYLNNNISSLQEEVDLLLGESTNVD